MKTIIIGAVVVVVLVLVIFRKSLGPFLRFLVSKLFLINLVLAAGTLTIITWMTFNNIESDANNDSENYQKHYLKVPDFKGVHLNDIEEFIGSRPFEYVISDSVYSDDAPAGTVLRQDPRPHSEDYPRMAKPGRTIYLTIVKQGGEYKVVPDLTENVETSYAIAKRKLEALGFRVTFEIIPSKNKGKVEEVLYKGKVVASGTKLLKGSVINIKYGSGEGGAAVKLPELKGLTILEANQQLTFAGLDPLLICDDCLTQEDSLNHVIYKQIPAVSSLVEGLIESGEVVTIYARKPLPGDTLSQVNDTLNR